MGLVQRLRLRGGGFRSGLRALHRDAGYLAVGLTLVYALSGLAVNHLADWDPNYKTSLRTHRFDGPLPGSDDEIARTLASKLSIREEPRDIYRASDHQLDVVFEHKTLHIDPLTGMVDEESQDPRFFLRAANALHLNRGKKAWTRIADAYAVALLYLALSGLFMIPGRKGLVGRGAILVTVGALLPVTYWVWATSLSSSP